MSLTELSTNFMHTQPFQIGSLDYDPKFQSIFPTYSINTFRSGNDLPTPIITPITYVHSNTDVITDPINVNINRTQPATLYTETSLHRHVDLANNRPSPIHHANYAPITAGENQQITNSSRPGGVLDERKPIYTNTDPVENPINNENISLQNSNFNIYSRPRVPRLSLPERSNFNGNKEIKRSAKSLSGKSRSSSDPAKNLRSHSDNNLSLSLENRSTIIPPPLPVGALSMLKSYQKTDKSYIPQHQQQQQLLQQQQQQQQPSQPSSWKPNHDRNRSFDYQFDKTINLPNISNSYSSLNSPILNDINYSTNHDSSSTSYYRIPDYSRYSDPIKLPSEGFRFYGSETSSHVSNHSINFINGYDNRSNRDFDYNNINNNNDFPRKRRNTLLSSVTKRNFTIFRKPKKNFPAYQKAIKALDDSQFNDAIHLFSLVLEKYPQSYSVRCDRAYASYQIEDWDRAIDDLTIAIGKKPRKARAYSLIGEVYRLLSIFEDSLINLNKSLKLQKSLFALRSRAETFIAIKRYDDAINDLNLALDIKPNNVFTMIRRAKVYYLIGQYNNALTDLNNAFELDHSNATSAPTLSNRGEIYRLLGRDDLALMDLNVSLQIKEDILTLERRGSVYISLGKDNDALEDFERILQIDPLHFTAHKNTANLLYKFKHYEKALKHFTYALNLKSDDYILLKTRGIIYQKLGFNNNAIKDFTSALVISPNNLDLLRYRGENFRLIQEFENSIKDFSKVLELDPKNVYALTRRGEVFRMLRQGSKALRDLDEAIRFDPDNVMARESRGAMNRTLRRFEESLRDLDEAIYLNPNSVFALSNRGAVFYMLRRCNEALIDLKKALKIDPNFTFALETRGALYNVLEKYNEALVDLNKVIELDPKNIWALTYRGEALIALKRDEDALEDLNKVLEISPNWEYPLSLRGAIYRSLDRNEEALADLERALNNMRDKAFNIDYETKALCNRGAVLFKMGNYNEALVDFNKVLVRDPKNLFALNERSAIYEALGKKDKAIETNNSPIIESEKSS